MLLGERYLADLVFSWPQHSPSRNLKNCSTGRYVCIGNLVPHVACLLLVLLLLLKRSFPPAASFDITFVGTFQKRKNEKKRKRPAAGLIPLVASYFFGCCLLLEQQVDNKLWGGGEIGNPPAGCASRLLILNDDQKRKKCESRTQTARGGWPHQKDGHTKRRAPHGTDVLHV